MVPCLLSLRTLLTPSSSYHLHSFSLLSPILPCSKRFVYYSTSKNKRKKKTKETAKQKKRKIILKDLNTLPAFSLLRPFFYKSHRRNSKTWPNVVPSTPLSTPSINSEKENIIVETDEQLSVLDIKKKKSKGLDLFDLCRSLEQDYINKKFYRQIYTRYPEPCFWILKMINYKRKPMVAYGVQVWRGILEDRTRKIPDASRKEWHMLL